MRRPDRVGRGSGYSLSEMRAPLGTPIGLLTVVAFLLAGPGAHDAGELVLVSDEDLVSIAARDGTGERVLATERTGPRGGFVYLHGPAWSPDGRWIAFASDRNYPVGEHSEIYSIRSDGACLNWLTNGSAESMMPAWRPAPGATGDPGTCGPARRPALSELDLRPMRTISGLRPWWLGPSFAGLIPSEVHAESDRGYLAYDDCVRFDRDRCPLSVELGEGSVCEDQRLVLALGRGRGAPRRSRRALLVGRPDYGRLAVLAGRTVVDLGSGGVEGSAAAMRNVRRAVRALRPLGLREAARRLPVGHAELRDRLRLLDALRAGGRLRTVRCGR